MKGFFVSLGLSLAALSTLVASNEAQACGGCFHIQQSESGQVTGHRMIFSVSNDQTTLWDQIAYEGNPESFAWVLPIKGMVDVGLSSDAMFAQLEQLTQVQVFSPDIDCGSQDCGNDFDGGAGVGGGGGGGGGVTVIAEETVGPFETVQLASSDPAALELWLESHGYVIPDDIVPVITAYVNEGFDFLAMRLAPGETVSSMRPVRVTSPGAGLGLPLRMVAAGTGAVTPITLWIVGEGRYEPANFPSFTIAEQDLVWSWDTMSSNYSQLKQAGFDASQGQGWLTEASVDTSQWMISDTLLYTAEYEPGLSGYGATADEALIACEEDLAALYGTLAEAEMRITRIHGQLSQAALATDLLLGASSDQSAVVPTYYLTQTTGTPPECPPPPDCSGGSGGGANGAGANGSGASGVGLWSPAGSGGNGGAGNGNGNSGGSGGCSMGGEAPAFGALLAAFAAVAASRRRRRQPR